MLKHCLKVVRCYINTKQRCHLYQSVSSCFPLLKSFQLTRQIFYNKEITLKRYIMISHGKPYTRLGYFGKQWDVQIIQISERAPSGERAFAYVCSLISNKNNM
ncbi:Hypothetical_protein [Hexamita inflata]|uniref:Hypothetical_protein n=1 Tax=Hexamita inflata TaxID=28002 RepID=A0AA86RCN1_9EUKA|nr:Hypothetical protein HINF_LOCUS57639 [Hexamita inflata]